MNPLDHANLRQKAEQLFKEKSSEKPTSLSEAETEKLLHEFEIRQIELELQIRELLEGKQSSAASFPDAEDWYKLLFENAPLGYQSLNANGFIIEVNQQWLDTLGYSRDEVIGKWFGDFLTPAFQDGFRKRFPVFKERGEIHSEFEMIHKDGSIHFIAFEGKICYDNSGAFRQTHCILQDITGRRQWEEKMTEKEDRYKMLFETMSQGVFYQSADGTLIDANESALKMMGITIEQFLGRTSYDPAWKIIAEDGTIIPPERHPSMLALNTGRPVENFTLGVYHPETNEYVWLIANAIPLFKNGDSSVHQVFVTLHDITEQRLANIKLEESEEKYHAVVDMANDGILILQDGIIKFSNASFAKMLGYSHLEVDKLEFSKLLPPEYVELQAERNQKSLSGISVPSIYETALLHKKGMLIPVEVNVSSVQYEEKPADLVVIRDITERKLAENEQFKLYNIIENSLNEIYIFDSLTLNFEYANQGALNNLGYSLDEIKNITPVHLKPEFTESGFRSMVASLIEGEKKTLAFSTIHKRKDGSTYPVDVHLQLFDQGDKSVFFAIINDLTDWQKTQSALIERETQLSFIQKSSGAGLWDWDMQTNTLKWSAELFLMLGLDPELDSASFENWDKAMHPDDKESAYSKLNDSIKNHIQLNNEYRVIHANGKELWINAIGNTTYDGEGKPIRNAGICIDISERKQADQVLREIIDKNPISIQIVDRDGYTLQTNAAHTRLFGAVPPPDYSIFKEQQIVNQGFVELFEGIKQGKSVKFPDFSFNIHDVYPELPDNPIWLRLVIFPLLDSSGNQDRYVLMHEDITDNKLAENRIMNQLNELRRWNEAMLNREERLLDLKREVNELLLAEGKPIRYTSVENTNLNPH